jgi:hypothetical protein
LGLNLPPSWLCRGRFICLNHICTIKSIKRHGVSQPIDVQIRCGEGGLEFATDSLQKIRLGMPSQESRSRMKSGGTPTQSEAVDSMSALCISGATGSRTLSLLCAVRLKVGHLTRSRVLEIGGDTRANVERARIATQMIARRRRWISSREPRKVQNALLIGSLMTRSSTLDLDNTGRHFALHCHLHARIHRCFALTVAPLAGSSLHANAPVRVREHQKESDMQETSTGPVLWSTNVLHTGSNVSHREKLCDA